MHLNQTITETIDLDTTNLVGGITFLSTVTGVGQTLNITTGDVVFEGAVGPLEELNIITANTFESSSIDAVAVQLTDIIVGATLNGALTVGSGGFAFTGEALTLNADATTTSSGAFTITNAGALTLDPAIAFTLDGTFTQNGTGDVTGGATIVTNGLSVYFTSPIALTGDLSIDSSAAGGAVSLGSIDGPYALTIDAASGDVSMRNGVGRNSALSSVAVLSAHEISMTGVGSVTTGITGALSLTAAQDILLDNVLYSAGSQSYSAGNEIQCNAGELMTFTSLGGPIAFLAGTIQLSAYNDFAIITNGGDFSFQSIVGTTFENISVHAGSGLAAMNTIFTLGTINNLDVTAGKITFAGEIDPINTNFLSSTDISNTGAPVQISSLNTVTFNALGGDVGTLASPILVVTSNQIFAGAHSTGSDPSLADFNGSSVDNTVHEIVSNPPCQIVFNGVLIKDCRAPDPDPRPKLPLNLPFAVPGVDSSYFNLGSYYFFLSQWLDDSEFSHGLTLYYVPSKAGALSMATGGHRERR